MVRKILVLLLFLPLLSCVDDGGYPDVTIYDPDDIVTLYEHHVYTAGGEVVTDPVLLTELMEYYPGGDLDEDEAETDPYKWTDMMFYDDVLTYCLGVPVVDITSVDEGFVIVVDGRKGDAELAAKIHSYGLLKYEYTDANAAIVPFEYLYRTGAIGKEIKLPLVVFALLTYNGDYDPEAAASDDASKKFLVEMYTVLCNEYNAQFPTAITSGQYLITSAYTLTLKKK